MDLRSLFGGLLTPDSADAPAPLPMDPMDEALPPHLRQFYGSPGSAPSLPPPALNRPQPGQTETPREIPLQEKAMAAARSAYNDVMSGAGSAAEGLLGIGQAELGPRIARGADAVNAKRKDINESLYTGGMNLSRKRFGDAVGRSDLLPPLPPRDPEDPYYGKEYPSLKRPQPGQDWEGTPKLEGEWANPYYTPQEQRRRIPIRPNAVRRT